MLNNKVSSAGGGGVDKPRIPGVGWGIMNGILMFIPLVVFVLIIWLVVCGFMDLYGRSKLGAFLALAGLCVLGFLFFILPLLVNKPVRVPRAKCMNNLHQIGLAMKMYAMDDDDYPMRFSQLTNYAGTATLYICPASGHLCGDMTSVDEWADYVMVSGLKESDPKDSVHAFCLPGCHSGGGANVLFCDGSVRWYEAKDFTTLTNDPVLFFDTSNQTRIAELKIRTHLIWPTNHIVRKKHWWSR